MSAIRQRVIDRQKEEAKNIDPFSKEKLVEGLKEGKFKKIIVMTGAGISVSAGVPDFRTAGTGLYDNLEEYKLPTPESIFDIEYFKEKPEAFYKLAATFLDLDKYKATPTHYFCKMLHNKGIMWKYLTQNIDNLESSCGFTQDDIIQAHGANFGATCSVCGKVANRETLVKSIKSEEVYKCTE